MRLPKRFYEFLFLLGLVAMVYLYTVAFDDFSETELVQLSYGWVGLIVFGAHGLIATEADAILAASSDTLAYRDALRLRSQQPGRSPFSYMAGFFGLSFAVVHKFVGGRNPLYLAVAATIVWLGLLFLFLEGIFPSL